MGLLPPSPSRGFLKDVQISTTINKWVLVAWCDNSWLAPPPPFPLRAPVKVSRWWGMVNVMEPGKPEKYPSLNSLPPKLKRKIRPSHWLHELSPLPKSLSLFLAWPLPFTSRSSSGSKWKTNYLGCGTKRYALILLYQPPSLPKVYY